MRRVLVMGPPGSGKSTLAKRLGARCGIPVLHLDTVFWRAGWVEAPADEFRTAIERMTETPAWIVEGNYTSVAMDMRLARADTLVYLDMPAWLCTARVLRRTILGYGRTRPDLAPGCPERLDSAFLGFVWTWNRLRRERILALAASFGGRVVVLDRRAARGATDRL